MKIQEYPQLIFLNSWIQLKNAWEQIKVCARYYYHWDFAKADACLFLTYLFDNPYKLSKRFLTRRGEKEIYAYGETPLSSLEEIAKICKIKSQDKVFELGCGRGATCFWLSTILKCSVVGIDYLPEFIQRAKRIQQKLKIKNLEFRLGDIADADLSGATVIYLYGTCLDESMIQTLIQKFKKLPAGTKIITVSYPLSDYIKGESPFEIMNQFEVSFTWGTADVFLQLVK